MMEKVHDHSLAFSRRVEGCEPVHVVLPCMLLVWCVCIFMCRVGRAEVAGKV